MHMENDNRVLSHLCQVIIENLTSSVILVNEKYKVKFINPAGEAMLGASLKQIMETDIRELFRESPGLMNALTLGFEEGQAFTERELELRRPHSSKTIKVDCAVTPLNPSQRNCELLIEIRQIDRLLRIAREEGLRAQQSAMKNALRGLAHEVKNPLGGLRGAAQLLERELPNADLKEYTQVIIGEADRLQKLVNHMLGSSQLPKTRRVNIHEVLERVRQLVQVESSPDLLITRDYDPSIPGLYGDQDQLIQAILNIVRNASQAISGKGEIILRSRTQRQFTIGQKCHRLVVRIDVIDNGPGIPADVIEQVFYPMVTGRADGTGLGLSIAQTLISQHGGVIECSSMPGETIFTLLLPFQARREQTHKEGGLYDGE